MTRAIRSAALAFSVVGLWLGAASSAHALAYTLNTAIIGFTAGSATVDILPVTDLSGTALTLAGSVIDTSSQDWFVFQIHVTSGTVTSAGVGNPQAFAEGMGYFNDADVTPSSGSLGTGSTPEFFFAGTPLSATSTSDRLFATFNLADFPGSGVFPVIPANTASFMINDGSNVYSITGSVVLVPVPEPGTIALLGVCGLAGLAAVRRALS